MRNLAVATLVVSLAVCVAGAATITKVSTMSAGASRAEFLVLPPGYLGLGGPVDSSGAVMTAAAYWETHPMGGREFPSVTGMDFRFAAAPAWASLWLAPVIAVRKAAPTETNACLEWGDCPESVVPARVVQVSAHDSTPPAAPLSAPEPPAAAAVAPAHQNQNDHSQSASKRGWAQIELPLNDSPNLTDEWHSTTEVPEPASLFLACAGLLALSVWRRRPA